MRSAIAFLSAGLMLFGSPSATAGTAPDRDLIARMVVPPEYLSISLSPDGRRLAGTAYNPQGSDVFIVELDTMQARTLAKPRRENTLNYSYTRSPISVDWIADDLLAVNYNDSEAESVDLQGKRVATLGEHYIRRAWRPEVPGDWVLVFRDIEDGDIGLVEARTGERRPYRLSLPGRLTDWAFDKQGRLRAATTVDTAFWSEKSRVMNWYRPSEDAPWQKLEDLPVTQPHFEPMLVTDDDKLVVIARHDRDTRAVFRYDPRSRRFEDMMAGHPTEDIDHVAGLAQETFASVRTEGLKPAMHWFDERRARLQQSVDAVLPGRINVLSGSLERVLVASYGDVDPGRWYLLDPQTMKMSLVARASSVVEPDKMRPMETYRYAAPDGLSIPAYLTRPAGHTGPAPLVVLIHGGPHARDSWRWNAEVQILAAHGYAVFQPQFRGSTGFGTRFLEAGVGQWGLAMQDDITAGVRDLVARGIADPKRVCIVGASYGGYAALWGAVKTPELYRCAVSFAGVSDLKHMFDDGSDVLSNPIAREVQAASFDPSRRGVQNLDDVSPLKHAGKVGVPLLLMHGQRDRRVPISHSEKMVRALKEHGKPHQTAWFPEEGHGFTYLKSVFRYHMEVLRFLDQHIGDGPRASAP